MFNAAHAPRPHRRPTPLLGVRADEPGCHAPHVGLLLLLLVAGASGALAQAPAAPANVEAHPTANTGVPPIVVEWEAVPGATSYIVYRSTSSGTETFYNTTTTNSYTDTNVVAGPPTIYYYKVAAVSSAGAGPESDETASPTPLPHSPGSGMVAGVAVPGGTRYYCADAALDEFDWFITLNGWFPSVLNSSAALDPNHKVVDMAYASEGTMTFYNVQVPTAGWYNITYRYAYSGGLFGGVNNREMGLAINGVKITNNMRFPITGDFETYQDSILQEHLNAGTNTIQMFNTKPWGISRADTLTVTTATGPGPSQPTNLKGVAGNKQATLTWTASTGATQYQVYRGSGKSDSEAVVPIATTTTPTYTDTGLNNGTSYYYNVSATNSVGISPDTDEVIVVPTSVTAPPATPVGVVATAGNTTITVSWTADANATSHSIYRSLSPGAEGMTPIGTVTGTATSFTNTNLANGTRYYYKVSAANSLGSSGQSAEVSAVPAAGAILQINCGGPAISPYAPDIDFTNGTAHTWTHAVDTSLLTGTLPPQATLLDDREGTFTYTLPGYVPSSTHTVTLYFVEQYWTVAGKRVFSVAANGTTVIANLDVFAAAGAQYKAIQRSFTTTANTSGQIVLTFSASVDQAKCSAILAP